MNFRWIVLPILVTIAVASGCACNEAVSSNRTAELRIAAHRIHAEIVWTREARARGLMYRASLPKDSGMLFIYPDERVLRFWMHDTQVPLDIAYIDAAGVIREVHYMKPLDESGLPSQVPVRYALEMNLGWFAEHQVGVGDRLEMPEDVAAIRGDP